MSNYPRTPLLFEDEFNLVSLFVRSMVAKLQMDAYFANGLGGTNRRSFSSAYTLRQQLDVVDPFREALV